MTPRYVAVRVLHAVIEKSRSLTDALLAELTALNDERDRAFVQALCYGVCRLYFKLDRVANTLLKKPLKKQDRDIYIVILIGLYQLMEMRLPDYAAVSQTVDVARQLKKVWAKNLINAVLRHYQRQATSLSHDDDAHPDWIRKKIQADWPSQWQTILHENNQHPPLALRVNLAMISREAYLKKLSDSDIIAHAIPETQSGIYLTLPMSVEAIPGFLQGESSVQDGAAQLATELLQVNQGQRVLDACAAPGGKASHIVEVAKGAVQLIAIDESEKRLKSVQANFDRLRLTATCLCADAGMPETWWDGQLFDRILLDAPCSGSGVIRRHPDIKLLRQASDIVLLQQKQQRLLTALWPLLKPNGLLVYATCSIFLEENVDVVQTFLAGEPSAKEEKITADWGIPCTVGRQILPGMYGMDGFYFACLRK